ncbi:MAG: cytochrome c-type biogenesis protein [Thermaurantiacus tibetensis]|uniref:cytochrome c-type biogenesis protein n=1 Tax=Thermaurantiacus tibetensis TaxID=2759035 RepID=UPI00188E0A1B|nr:cytochrome c-type biogenesis protein [Thermaurantiacus tibetensis]
MRCLAVAASLLLLAAPAVAVEPDETLADPALEARAREIARGLRCVQCQNQSIDESSAPLARDLRRLVRERLAAGDSDAEVVAEVRARYGDFVLLKPPFDGRTLLLWVGPFAVLVVAGGLLVRRLGRMRPDLDEEPDGAGQER